MTNIIPKQYQSQIIIGATIKVGPNDDAWAVQQQVSEFLAGVLGKVPPQLEITSVSSSFIPKAPNPMDFMNMAPPGGEEPAEPKGDAVAGSISPKGGQPS